MQASDGNLVLYHEGKALWAAGEEGAGAYLAMQADGNLVIYSGGAAKWSSNTAGFPGASLQMQNDGNAVVYQDGHPIWDRNSGYLGDRLENGWSLAPGAYLLSSDHQYRLLMQSSDGNLVLYHEGNALWASGQAGGGASVVMQGDGNLVIYNAGKAKWASNTAGFGGDYLALQDDSNLVLYDAGHPVWDRNTGYLGDQLRTGWTLQPDAYLLSPDGQYRLIMQASDGNLVIYKEGKALWATGQEGAGAYLVMQGDGNLVIYNNGQAKWSSNTAGDSGDFLQLQDDGNLVIYKGSTALWDWHSGNLSGGGQTTGGQPTAAETAAVHWATARIGSTAWYGLCLSFAFDAYLDGAGMNLKDRTSGVAYNEDTDPEDVWGHTDAGTTGTGTPPYGALVFFDAKPGYNPEDFSHVTIMGASGEMISTPDAFDESNVHYETLAQFSASGSYSTYVGWWLPDG